MVRQVVDIDNTYEIALGKKRAFGDDRKGREGSKLSKKNEDRLEEIVTAWTKQHTHEEVEAILQKAGVAAHMVSRPSDVYKDKQLEARNYWVPLQHEVMGMQKWEPQSCFIMSKTPRQIVRPSPLVGQHNEYVFKELIGMSDDEIAEHIIDGSITTQMDAPMVSTF